MVIITITICDDNDVYLNKIKNLILNNINGVKVLTYSSGKKLLEDFEGKEELSPIILLDVEMPEITGLEVAEKINRINKNIKIIFITNYNEFSREGYKVSAFRYVLKTDPEDEILSHIKIAVQDYRKQNEIIKIQTRDSMVPIKVSEIMYAEIRGRKIYLHTKLGDFDYNDKISSFESKYSTYNFARCHKSFLVNLLYVLMIQDRKVVLRDQNEIDIGKTFRESFEKAFVRYAAERS